MSSNKRYTQDDTEFLRTAIGLSALYFANPDRYPIPLATVTVSAGQYSGDYVSENAVTGPLNTFNDFRQTSLYFSSLPAPPTIAEFFRRGAYRIYAGCNYVDQIDFGLLPPGIYPDPKKMDGVYMAPENLRNSARKVLYDWYVRQLEIQE